MKLATQLIVGGSWPERIEKAQRFIAPFFSQAFNLETPPPDLLVVKPENSVGINQIRNLKKFLSLKPYQAQIKVALLLQAEKMTLPAQNSLLKTLEEPPPHSWVILLASQPENLLPTIVSRVKITRLPAKSQILVSPKEKEQLYQTLTNLLKSGVGERMALSLKLVKDKNQALALVENLLFLWRELLLIKSGVKKDGPPFLAKISLVQIKKAVVNTEQIRKMLVANVNFHLAIESLFLSYPKVS